MLSRAGKELLFKLIVLAHVRYCATILSMANKTDIEKLQNKGVRAMLKKRRIENVNGLFNDMGYLTVDREIKRDVLTFIYRIKNNILRGYLKCLVSRNKDVHGYVTRQIEQFYIERVQNSK